MNRLLLSLATWLALCCAVNAQMVPSGGGAMVPTTAPGVQVNLNAAVDPTINNDQTQGYQVGSLWQNAGTGRVFIARSVGTGAAVWTNLELADHPGYIASNWYIPDKAAPVAAGSAPGTGSIRLYPTFIKERATISALGVRVTTLSGGGNVQAAIYANNPATMRPTGAALVSTASMSTASAASVNAAISLQLNPGMYWFASNCDNGTAIFTAFNSNASQMSYIIGSATQANSLGAGAALVGLSVAQAFNTWPDLTSGSFTEINGAASIPIVQYQIGSVP